VGYEDEACRIEKRVMSPVYPQRMADFWESFGQPFSVVHDRRDYAQWVFCGGHALISKDQVRKNLPNEMEATPSVREGFLEWVDARKLPKDAFQKAPTRKLRMKVLKRDSYRCIICGQRPADDVNVQLNLHHVRPRENGGLTVEKNLISICQTCHQGLDPHFDCNLYSLIEKKSNSDADLKSARLRDYLKSVDNYRKSLGAFIQSSTAFSSARKP
jgi:hypothetical protein